MFNFLVYLIFAPTSWNVPPRRPSIASLVYVYTLYRNPPLISVTCGYARNLRPWETFQKWTTNANEYSSLLHCKCFQFIIFFKYTVIIVIFLASFVLDTVCIIDMRIYIHVTYIICIHKSACITLYIVKRAKWY